MVRRLLPKTRQMFACFFIVGQPCRWPNEFDSGLQLPVIPSREDGEGASHLELGAHKLVSVICDLLRGPSHSLGMTEITEGRSQQNRAPSSPPRLKMRCHHFVETKTRSMIRHRDL